ncbi:MAG TPA: alpha-L-arabinofuranosidase C-terminal domain-containing protein, partial [Abditibacterium sp.]
MSFSRSRLFLLNGLLIGTGSLLLSHQLSAQTPAQAPAAPAPNGAAPAPAAVTVQVDKPGAKIPATLTGLFFEDINFAGDGGLYPERVKNRNFEFPDALMGWKPLPGIDTAGSMGVLTQIPLNVNNLHYLRLENKTGAANVGLSNEGFRGVGVRAGDEYRFSLYARSVAGKPTARVEIVSAEGKSLGSANVAVTSPGWKQYFVTLRATGTAEKARLNLLGASAGTFDADMVSLMPVRTWNRRPNGLRADLVSLLREMKPGFLRFPGGCIVEGRTLEQRYQWKTTVGDPAQRKLIVNRWNTEFRHRLTPDYYQSMGLGYFEYFQLSEDIGAQPLPIMNCGMACQYNSKELCRMEDIGVYIQDALDVIDFANAPVSNPWGALRARMGHPKPFGLKMLGVGNEQWGPQYIERYVEFAKVLKAKHPEIELVSGSGPSPDGKDFDFAWEKLRELNAEVIDEHYYKPATWFFDNSNRYNNYSRTGPKVFAGEYAAQSEGIARPGNKNTWECALSEAAFMTGLERNADVVKMTSYAPLFGHVDAWQWTPNLIWFDNLRSYGTTNYQVQKLFSTNRGSQILP